MDYPTLPAPCGDAPYGAEGAEGSPARGGAGGEGVSLIANGSTAVTPTGCGKNGGGICHATSTNPVASEPWQPQPKGSEQNCQCGRDRASQGTQPPFPPARFWWQVVIVLLATRDQGSATTGQGVGRGRVTPPQPPPPSCPSGFWNRAEPSPPVLGQPSGYMTRVRGQFGVQFLTMLSQLWGSRSWVCWGIPC